MILEIGGGDEMLAAPLQLARRQAEATSNPIDLNLWRELRNFIADRDEITLILRDSSITSVIAISHLRYRSLEGRD